MEENTQLPKEVVADIEKQSEAHNARLKEHAESEKDETYAQGFAEGWHEGATTYATKLHQANETIKVLTYDNNRLKGEVEGLTSAVEELKGMIMRHAIAFASWLLPSGCIANEKDYELFLMKPEAVLDESAVGREDDKPFIGLKFRSKVAPLNSYEVIEVFEQSNEFKVKVTQECEVDRAISYEVWRIDGFEKYYNLGVYFKQQKEK